MTDSAQTFGLHHVQLAIPAGAEARCRDFYVDLLGLVEIEKPVALADRGGVWLRSGTLEIHLGVEENFGPARKAHPGILVQDIDELAKHLVESWVEVEWDDGFPGYRRFYCFDSVGNRLEFLSPE